MIFPLYKYTYEERQVMFSYFDISEIKQIHGQVKTSVMYQLQQRDSFMRYTTLWPHGELPHLP